MKYSKDVYVALERISQIGSDNMKKLKQIAENDDWSFIIKMIAIVESALTGC